MQNETALKDEYLNYLIDTMPTSDRDNYPLSLFEEFAEHGAFLKQNIPWCKELDPALFLDYVLYHRINDEDISSHRQLFFDEIYPRLQGMDIQEAVLEVNRWCHENVTYHQRDDRTASPLTVYSCGIGRCGEESVFAVAALRSVGIPSRQVYAPRWSHCGDNHAWVEVFTGDDWHFFGACEPEPVLDRGWFNSAAARAVLVHSRRFGKLGGNSAIHGDEIGTIGPAVFHNQTARYAEVIPHHFKVTQNGHPIPGALLYIEILNDAQLFTAAVLTADSGGRAEISLGRGSFNLRAVHPSGCTSMLCNDETVHLIELNSPSQKESGPCSGGISDERDPFDRLEGDWQDFDFIAPPGLTEFRSLTAAQKEQRGIELKQGNEIRTKRSAGLGNAEIQKFLNRDNDELRRIMVQNLAEKDRCDVTAEILEDHCSHAEKHMKSFPKDIFEKYLLSPRIATEKLTAWRGFLAKAFGENSSVDFASNPRLLWQELCKAVPEKSSYPNLYWNPSAAFSAGRWDEKSRALLFTAAMRSLGIPSRIKNGKPEYFEGGMFLPVTETWYTRLNLTKSPDDELIYKGNWSISSLENEPRTIDIENARWEDNRMSLMLPIGQYRILSSARLPNGNQYASSLLIDLQGEATAPVCLRKYSMKDVPASNSLPPFTAEDCAGSSIGFPIAGEPSLLLWLVPGEEPTQHVLNELLEADERIDGSSIKIFLRDKTAAAHELLQRVLKVYPKIELYYGDWDYNIETAARSLFCDPDNPPLMVCCDKNAKAQYAISGYNVGSVRLFREFIT